MISNCSYRPETLNSGQNWRLLSRVTLQFVGWSWKAIWHFFYAVSSFVHHFIAIIEFKLELQSGNTQFGSKYFKPCDLEIWRMILKNNRAPLLSNIKPFASFHHHMWIQTVPKRLSWVLITVTLTFDSWPSHFAWPSRLAMVIISENVRMMRWQEHCQKVWQTDERTETDGQTERSVLRAVWSQLRTTPYR